MNISPRLACQLCAVCFGGNSHLPSAADLMSVLDAAIAEDKTLAREFGHLRSHMSNYDVRETLIRTGDTKLASLRAG